VVYYLDTSAWIAWKFAQEGQNLFKKVSLKRDSIVSSPLLVAEYVAFLRKIDKLKTTRFEEELSFIRWIYPADPLFPIYGSCRDEIALRGADFFHIATALWFCGDHTSEVCFLSCDGDQTKAAKSLGFQA